MLPVLAAAFTVTGAIYALAILILALVVVFVLLWALKRLAVMFAIDPKIVELLTVLVVVVIVIAICLWLIAALGGGGTATVGK